MPATVPLSLKTFEMQLISLAWEVEVAHLKTSEMLISLAWKVVVEHLKKALAEV